MLRRISSPNRRRILLASLFGAALNLGLILPAYAGVNEWTQIGPEGGQLCALAVAPSNTNIVYAVGAGLFRSEDGGATWASTGAPLEALSCFLSVDAADPDRLYAIRSDRLMRSLDGGRSWQATEEGLTATYTRFPIAVSAADPNFLLFCFWDKIYRSLDRGDSWQQVSTLQGTWLVSMAIDPLVPGRGYAVADSSKVYVSEDYGETWSLLGGELPKGVTVETLHFDPLDPSLWYVMTRGGLYRSLDRGESWTRVLPASSNLAAGVLAIRPDSTLYSLQTEARRKFLLVSRDQGTTWLDLGTPFPDRPAAEFSDFVASGEALLVAGEGIVRSADGGATWQKANSGILAVSLRSLTLDRQNPRTFVAIDPDAYMPRLWHSGDRGTTWSRTALPPEVNQSTLVDVGVDPADSNQELLATHAVYNLGFSGVALSSDAGATWIPRPVEVPCLRPFQASFDPARSGRIYLLGSLENIYCHPDCYTLRSDDAGLSWQCIDLRQGDEYARSLAPSPSDSGIVLAANTISIYRSANAGAAWTEVAGPPFFLAGAQPDLKWASANTVYATSATDGLFVSHDAGVTWSRTTIDLEDPAARRWLTELVVDPFHPEVLVALARAVENAAAQDVVRSVDGGVTWSILDEGLLGWGLSDLTIDPVTPNRLYVSAAGGGVLAYDIQIPEPCVPSSTALCITEGRFKIESLWRDFAGHSGVGHAAPLASDTGGFWFFDADNLELFVKEIDGTGFNDAFWTFYGALSNVEFTLLATDTATGAQHGYFNRSRTFASLGDIESFPQEEALASAAVAPVASAFRSRIRPLPQRSANSCTPNATTLCLAGGRFAASVTWRDFAGRTGVGTPIVLTPDTGSFWFFDAGIHELAVKVIDGRGTNNAYWVFYGSLSNVEFDLTVVDTVTGDRWSRHNPSGTFASNGDIEAFPQLP